MGNYNDMVIDKQPLGVKLVALGEDPCDGQIYLKQDERLSDIMNDGREFLPFHTAGGVFKVIGKASISSVTPVDPGSGPVGQITDSTAMSVDVARQILALEGLFDRTMLFDQAAQIKASLDTCPLDLSYIETAVDVAVEVLLGELRMDALN